MRYTGTGVHIWQAMEMVVCVTDVHCSTATTHHATTVFGATAGLAPGQLLHELNNGGKCGAVGFQGFRWGHRNVGLPYATTINPAASRSI